MSQKTTPAPLCKNGELELLPVLILRFIFFILFKQTEKVLFLMVQLQELRFGGVRNVDCTCIKELVCNTSAINDFSVQRSASSRQLRTCWPTRPHQTPTIPTGQILKGKEEGTIRTKWGPLPKIGPVKKTALKTLILPSQRKLGQPHMNLSKTSLEKIYQGSTKVAMYLSTQVRFSLRFYFQILPSCPLSVEGIWQ